MSHDPESPDWEEATKVEGGIHAFDVVIKPDRTKIEAGARVPLGPLVELPGGIIDDEDEDLLDETGPSPEPAPVDNDFVEKWEHYGLGHDVIRVALLLPEAQREPYLQQIMQDSNLGMQELGGEPINESY